MIKIDNFNLVLNNLSTFSKESLKKGKVFEYYCKWFLENDTRYSKQLKKVWLWSEWPKNWGIDKGIDLIAETYDGKTWAIQTKAYDKNHYITKEDVDKFLSESSRKIISYRLLIATTNNIGPNSNEVLFAQEKPIGLCLLNQLTQSNVDWSIMLSNINKQSTKIEYSPRPHQKEAIKDIIKGFEKSNIGQIHMACGTGKTLVGLWIAETLKSQNTLVLVPSISLLSQTYQEWSKNNGFLNNFYPILVCSDPSAGEKDQIYSSPSELGFPVTTNSKDIVNAFLSTSKPKVIFSTYQSSPEIEKACKINSLFNFDLVIADEAHRCAGRLNSSFTTIIKKNAIQTKRKLFMTATPKIFSSHIKQKTKELKYKIASMDNLEKFGPVFHKLSFSKAIELNLLSDYKIIIAQMNHKKYSEYIKKGKLVSIKEYETDARTLANQLLVAKTIKEHNLKRIISFHNKINSAKEFINTFSKAINLLPEKEKPNIVFKEKIFGNMRQNKRLNIMKNFKDPLRTSTSLLANVKCLSEGVDVPILDGIAFIDPKGSEIDIVQAVGRAIRKPPKNANKISSIIIPIFINNEDNKETHLNQSSFKTIFRVVNALRAHDKTLAEELDSLQLELGEKRFKKPPKLNKFIFSAHTQVDQEFIRKIKVEILKNCTSTWNHKYELLKKCIESHKEWFSTRSNIKNEQQLALWCSRQRYLKNKNQLEFTKIKKLNAINFPWNMKQYYSDQAWLKQFRKLENFKKNNPNKSPSSKSKNKKIKNLSSWFSKQCKTFENHNLEPWKIEKLLNIGCTLDIPKKINEINKIKWLKNFEYLEKLLINNSSKLPSARSSDKNEKKLAKWCEIQRNKYKNNVLEKWQINKLEKLKFLWDPKNDNWNKQYSYLLQYREKYPNRWPKNKECFPDNNRLGDWCHKQRLRKNTRTKEQTNTLNSIGFPW